MVHREELGLSVEEVAARSELTLDEVDSIENNAVDTPVPNLVRYAPAVELRLDVRVTAATHASRRALLDRALNAERPGPDPV